MKKIEQKEIQPMLNDILLCFKKFCKENNITFYLAYGTLLGAVRHQGFIPWDDDLDLLMKKEEINKLRNVLKKQNSNYIDNNKRYLVSFPLDEGNVYPFIKIIDTQTMVYERNISHKYSIGLWIDIFELEYCPNDINECKRLAKKQHFYANMNKIMIAGNFKDMKFVFLNCITIFIKQVFKLLSLNSHFWVKKMLSLSSNEPTDYLGCVCFGDSSKDRIPARVYEKTTKIQFEGNYYSIVSDYDLCLSSWYGDYMKIPEEKDRKTHRIEGYKI